MALNLKIASLYADLTIKTAAFDATLAKVEKRLAGLKDPKLVMAVNTAAATAAVARLMAQLQALQAQATVRVNVGGFGRGGGGGGGRGGASPTPGGPDPMDFVSLGKVQFAGLKYQDALRAQVATAQRAADARTRAAQRAADAQIAADARVQAAHQRSVAAQTRAADRAYAQQVAAANRAAAAQARAAARVAAAHATSARQFGTGVGQGLGLPFAMSPEMMGGQLVGAGIKAAVGTAIDLEAKFAEVRRVAGLSADETARLKRELMAISTTQPGASLDDLIKMADIGGRMGLAGQDLREFSSGLAMVKNSVSGMDTEDLANNMARVLHVFKLGPEYIKGFGSALTAMDNATTASASDILQITQGLSGTAAAIGLTLPQVVALSGALKDVGLTNAVASTAMSQVFRKMATDMDKFAAAAQVDAKVFADAYRKDPMAALALLMNRLNSMGDTIAVQQTLKSLGLEGLRVGGALQQLAAAFAKVAPLTATANDEFKTLKSLMGADGLKGETTAAALGKLGNAATQFGDALGSHALPVIKEMTNDMLALARALEKGTDAFAGFKGAAGKLPAPVAAGAGAAGAAAFNPFGGAWGGWKALTRGAAAAAPAPPAAPAKPPPLPAKPAPFVPPFDARAPRIAEATALYQGLASRLGLTLDRVIPKGADVKNRGTLRFGFRGDGTGLAGNGAGQALRGFLTGSLADKLAGANKLAGGNLADAVARAVKDVEAPRAQAGLSGADFARQQQENILNGKKADEQLAETRGIGATLREMRDILSRGANNAAAALLAP